MFELTKEEFENLRSQFVTSSWGGTRYFPMAFTEQGVAMLSIVLRFQFGTSKKQRGGCRYFPMFQLTAEEYKSLRSQNVTLKRGQHSKYLPYAFTEQGVAMLRRSDI